MGPRAPRSTKESAGTASPAFIPCCAPVHNGICNYHLECNSPGKRPLVSWKKYTKWGVSPVIAAYWDEKYPFANRAMLTGAVSGITVLDVEARDLDIAQGLGLKDPNVRSQGGGIHFYFNYDPRLRSTVLRVDGHKLGDLKSDGGYVLVPPSRGLQGQYQWLSGTTLYRDAPRAVTDILDRMQDARDLLVRHLPAPEGDTHKVSDLDPRTQSLIAEGSRGRYPSRSEADFSVIAELVRSGWSDDEVTSVFDACEIGDKYRSEGYNGPGYLRRTIDRARRMAFDRAEEITVEGIVVDAAMGQMRDPTGRIYRGLRLRLTFDSTSGKQSVGTTLRTDDDQVWKWSSLRTALSYEAEAPLKGFTGMILNRKLRFVVSDWNGRWHVVRFCPT